MLGELDGAIDDFTHAIELYPEYGESYLNRGVVKEMQRDVKGACRDWQKASDLGVISAENYINNQCE